VLLLLLRAATGGRRASGPRTSLAHLVPIFAGSRVSSQLMLDRGAPISDPTPFDAPSRGLAVRYTGRMHVQQSHVQFFGCKAAYGALCCVSKKRFSNIGLIACAA
jgi:hypothetical protein